MFVKQIPFKDETNPKSKDSDFVWVKSKDPRVMTDLVFGGCYDFSSSRPNETRFNDSLLESDEFPFEFEYSEVNEHLALFLSERII